MEGGRLDLALRKSWLQVDFSAYADLFMHFHRFCFEAAVAVLLYASATLACRLFTYRWGPEQFSADLALRGPPVSGEAHMHFWRWSITVCFGPPPLPMPPMNLNQFLRMVMNIGQDVNEEEFDPSTAHLLSITKGAITSKETARFALDMGRKVLHHEWKRPRRFAPRSYSLRCKLACPCSRPALVIR
jgi:hypothetical protein